MGAIKPASILSNLLCDHSHRWMEPAVGEGRKKGPGKSVSLTLANRRRLTFQKAWKQICVLIFYVFGNQPLLHSGGVK